MVVVPKQNRIEIKSLLGVIENKYEAKFKKNCEKNF